MLNPQMGRVTANTNTILTRSPSSFTYVSFGRIAIYFLLVWVQCALKPVCILLWFLGKRYFLGRIKWMPLAFLINILFRYNIENIIFWFSTIVSLVNWVSL